MTVSRKDVLLQLAQLAPLRLAESWDNVGVIVDTGSDDPLSHALLTIDLTEQTLEEGLELGAELMIAYHPPIFGGLKRLRASRPGEKLIIEAIRRGIMIYSPHTALDAAEGGMAEWLASCLGEGTSEPLVPDAEDARLGAGRRVELLTGLPLDEAIERIKRHLGLRQVRLAAPRGLGQVQRFAVCPGAGGSLFQAVGAVDLLLTGEMRHHDVLARCAEGTAVVLTDHTNTERGYLPHFAERLRAVCPGLLVSVSARDADPLRIV